MRLLIRHLREADPEKLADLFVAKNLPSLLDVKDQEFTAKELLEQIRAGFLDFLKGLLEREPEVDTEHVLCLSRRIPFVMDKEEPVLYSIDELEGKKTGPHMPERYSFSFQPWNKILGTPVAETELVKDNMEEFLVMVLDDMTFFGYEEAAMEKEHDKLREAMEELNQPGGPKGRPADEVFAEMGIKRPHYDEKEKEFQNQILTTQTEYIAYVRKLEIEEVRAAIHKPQS